MPYTPNFAPGDVLTAANMNSIGDAWTAFTPTWTAATTNPAIGNGSFDCRYQQINKLVVAHYRVAFGSTTTYGTGQWRFSLPITADSEYNSGDTIGWGYAGELGNFAPMTLTINNTTTTNLFYYGVVLSAVLLAAVEQGSPITFGNNDGVNFTLIYEAA